MSSFIAKLVKDLKDRFGKDLGELCLVFPSRRACVFFKDTLQKSLSGPAWSPGIFAIEDFVREVHPRTILDSVSLTFELYPIYRQYFPDEPFDKFYSWGNMLVNDFDEVDQYMVDGEAIFRNLFELKSIDATIDGWLEEEGELSDFQGRYLQFWELMGTFYTGLRAKLDAQHKASPGMAMRELAEQFRSEKPNLPWQRVIFAGLNALTPAEELMVKSLVDHDLAECYWDLDAYYVDDPYQEAGHFFRQLRERWKLEDWSWIQNHLSGTAKKVTLTGVPQRVGQAKVAGLKLKEWQNPAGPEENIALVLGDENLLFPLLHSLPPDIGKINVTMGYPLRNTPLYSLVDSLIQMHENAERLRPDRKSKVYYFRDVVNILRHPYIAALLKKTGRDLLYRIERRNMVYISPGFFAQGPPDGKSQSSSEKDAAGIPPFGTIDQAGDTKTIVGQRENDSAIGQAGEIKTKAEGAENHSASRSQRRHEEQLSPEQDQEAATAWEFLAYLFQPWDRIDQVVDYFLQLYRRLKQSIEGKSARPIPTIESEYLFHFFTLTQKLRDKLEAYILDFDLRIFRRLYKEVIQNSSIPFSGEPLEGLQVMGMLETRALDFDRVMILSVNEGVLPAKANTVSFIPYTLRKGFGLPVNEDKDAIFAYHFYRLLQRASEVVLVFNTEPDTFGSGEKSRFVAQLEAELPSRNPQLELEHETMSFPLEPESIHPVSVLKDGQVIETLKTYVAEKGLSPSAISTYFHCPLQFYFRYVLRLREQEELEESMEENTFGSVLHSVLEFLYQPFLGGEVKTTDIEAFADQLDQVIEQQFIEVTETQNHQYGRNRLLLGVIRNLVEKLLEIDHAAAPFKVVGLEMELDTLLPTLKMPDGVQLRGYIDRVDEVDGQLRIIDYKTGKVNKPDLKGFEEIREGAKKREAFQLSTYAYLYLRNFPEVKEVSPGIFFMRNLTDGLRFLETGPTKSTALDLETLLDYESEMVSVIDEIFDPGVPFVQTEELDRCKFCPYKVICHRN